MVITDHSALHLATPDPVPLFPTLDNHFPCPFTAPPLLFFAKFQALFLACRELLRLRLFSVTRPQRNSPNRLVPFSRPSSDVRALRRCCHPQEQPQTGAVFVEIPYLPLTGLVL
jgi:hypothetical protein